jgi:hypothetical protein
MTLWIRAFIALERQVIRLSQEIKEIRMDLTKLNASNDAMKAAIDSAVAKIQDLANQLKGSGAADQAAVDAVADQITAEAQALSDAVAAN